MKLTISLLLSLILTSVSLGQAKHKKSYIFGHSLIDHRPPLNPTTADETTVPHWVHLLATHSGHTYGATGQYGFLRGHISSLPPDPNWGYGQVPGVWDQDFQDFGDANMYDVLITLGNFIQASPPNAPYDDGIDDGLTPVSATGQLIDYLSAQEDDSLNIFIYENWPEMGGFLAAGWPATESEYDNYNAYLRGAFHSWWLDLYQSVRASRPNINVRMIPVGPIIADLTDGLLNDVPVADYYEDADPHGRPNIYFLAGLITYMAIYEEVPAPNFSIPNSIHQEIVDHYPEVVTFIWDELNNFTDSEGNNMVFPAAGVAADLVRIQDAALFIEDSAGIIMRGRDTNCYNIFMNQAGVLTAEEVTCPQD